MYIYIYTYWYDIDIDIYIDIDTYTDMYTDMYIHIYIYIAYITYMCVCVESEASCKPVEISWEIIGALHHLKWTRWALYGCWRDIRKHPMTGNGKHLGSEMLPMNDTYIHVYISIYILLCIYIYLYMYIYIWLYVYIYGGFLKWGYPQHPPFS